MSLLENINNPSDLKKLDKKELAPLCAELRSFIVDKLSSNPGHLGSSLGAVEIAVAVHYVYNTPHDKLVWDVGHQAYAHKILTGRREQFETNRKKDGISGFPKRCESQYDAFGGGHASVSISAALGMDVASKQLNEGRKCIAVIGDGSMSGGLAFEGLNNAGAIANDLLVILNDNDMSIDPNVGALKDYLLYITTSKRYNKVKSNIKSKLKGVPFVNRFVHKLWTGLKSSLLQSSNLFEAFHFRYFGTVDGNDIAALVSVLEDMRDIPGPKLLHLTTVKGKGYKPAEESQTTWHAPGTFDTVTGVREVADNTLLRYQDIFGHTVTELAEKNSKIVGVTPAMPTGCSLNIMQKVMPERVFDVGIAEGHAVTFSGGMATSGLLPFCNIYSTFMQRAYDNVIHDVVLQKCDVVFCLDRAGIVGEDGVTHHGLYDIAIFRTVPDVIISSPLDDHELRNLMYTASEGGYGAFIIRYPRAKGVHKNWRNEMRRVEIGSSQTLKEGRDIALLSFGPIGNIAKKAIERAERERDVSVKHIDLRFAKPLDTKMLHDICRSFSKIITIEDGSIAGGVGSAILEFMSNNNYNPKIVRLGVPDTMIQHAHVNELMAECGYDEEGIYNTIVKMELDD